MTELPTKVIFCEPHNTEFLLTWVHHFIFPVPKRKKTNADLSDWPWLEDPQSTAETNPAKQVTFIAKLWIWNLTFHFVAL